jgi:peptidoglycan/LPS O-acetylase OafA/YrhL
MGFIAGLFLTSLPLSEFLHNPQTWKYLGANAVFLNYLQPTLPGVFEENVIPFVNASLWTMKVEIMFYISVPIVYWLINRFGRNKVVISIVLLSILYDVLTAELYNYTGNPVYAKLNHQVFGMFAYFYMPVLLLFNKETIRKHIIPLLVLSIPLLLCAYSNEWAKRFSPFTLSIVLVAFAYGVKKLHFSYGRKDVSYEFYLLHFPILQIFLAFFPGISLSVLFITSLTSTLVLAVALNKVQVFKHV